MIEIIEYFSKSKQHKQYATMSTQNQSKINAIFGYIISKIKSDGMADFDRSKF